jgi:hypothetical protein
LEAALVINALPIASTMALAIAILVLFIKRYLSEVKCLLGFTGFRLTLILLQ